MHAPPGSITRYTYFERASHWLLAIGFFLAGLSGLAFFHPSLFWLTNLFGGGPWTRILHPFLGLFMSIFFVALGMRVGHHNVMDASDKEWLKHAGDVMAGHEELAPPAGRYNAGQKVLFWLLALCMLGLIVTGFVFWRPYFAPLFPVWLVRLSTLLHAIAATGAHPARHGSHLHVVLDQGLDPRDDPGLGDAGLGPGRIIRPGTGYDPGAVNCRTSRLPQ